MESVEALERIAAAMCEQIDKLREKITDAYLLGQLRIAEQWLRDISGMLKPLAQNPQIHSHVVWLMGNNIETAKQIIDPLQKIMDAGGTPISIGG